MRNRRPLRDGSPEGVIGGAARELSRVGGLAADDGSAGGEVTAAG